MFGHLGAAVVPVPGHGAPPLGARFGRQNVNSVFSKSFPQIFFQNTVFASVVAEQGLLVFPREAAVAGRTRVGSTLRKYFVDLLLEVLHHQVVLLLAVLVLRLGFEPAKFAGVSCPNPVQVFGKATSKV